MVNVVPFSFLTASLTSNRADWALPTCGRIAQPLVGLLSIAPAMAHPSWANVAWGLCRVTAVAVFVLARPLAELVLRNASAQFDQLEVLVAATLLDEFGLVALQPQAVHEEQVGATQRPDFLVGRVEVVWTTVREQRADLRVVARDIADFERVLRRRIMTLPGVGQVEANVLLTEEARPGPLG